MAWYKWPFQVCDMLVEFPHSTWPVVSRKNHVFGTISYNVVALLLVHPELFFHAGQVMHMSAHATCIFALCSYFVLLACTLSKTLHARLYHCAAAPRYG